MLKVLDNSLFIKDRKKYTKIRECVKAGFFENYYGSLRTRDDLGNVDAFIEALRVCDGNIRYLEKFWKYFFKILQRRAKLK